MSRLSPVWRVVVVLFVLVNVLGACYAILRAERMHAAIHLGLLAGTYVAWRIATRRTATY